MKKKFALAALAAVITLSTVVGTSTTSYAKEGTKGVYAFSIEEQKLMRQVFDAKHYAHAYPDVVKVLGNNENKLFAHYLTAGIFEGRDASATFNADAYASANKDLAAVYDTDNNVHDLVNYVFHYVVCGKKEGRVATIADATKNGIAVTSVMHPEITLASPAGTTTSNATAGYSESSNGGSAVYTAPSASAPAFTSSAAPAPGANPAPAPAPAPSAAPAETHTSNPEAKTHSESVIHIAEQENKLF